MNIKKVGIDAGGSLVKIAYEENGVFHYKKYPIKELASALQWLKMVAPNATVALTGGKAAIMKDQFFPEGTIFPEFDSACEGALFLLKEAEFDTNKKFIIVNIGTGTSWFVADHNTYTRILGSGIGGGTLMGLGALLTGETNFSKLVELASRGNKGNVDLLVKDIYYPQEPPIDGNLTASNFAKGVLNQNHTKEDMAAAVINMIGETLVLLSMQAVQAHGADRLVYIGSTLSGNEPLKQCLSSYKKMVGIDHVFLDHGEYAGALGALLLL
jgi:type II pantothenate kinase